MLCKLCGLSRKLIKAHIIPESFFRESSKGTHTRLISNNLNEFSKQAPVGIYDREILCEQCEKKFGPLDEYGGKVFISEHDSLFSAVKNVGEVVGFCSDKIDKEKLHRFILSVLWRASVSKQRFYEKVCLGVHEEVVKSLMFSLDKNKAKQFSIVIARWVSQPALEPVTKIQLNPEKVKLSGVNSYVFYFGKTIVYVKVDQRPFPADFTNLAFYSSSDLLVVARSLDKSKELKLMREIVHRRPKELKRSCSKTTNI
jgi:hypothetical protein